MWWNCNSLRQEPSQVARVVPLVQVVKLHLMKEGLSQLVQVVKLHLIKEGRLTQLVRVVQVVQLVKLHLITAVLNEPSPRSVSAQIAPGSLSHKKSRN